MQNIRHLSSGEYGKFTKPATASSRSSYSRSSQPESSPLPSYRSETKPSARESKSATVHSSRGASIDSAGYRREPVGVRSAPESIPYSQITHRSKMKQMFNELDSSFSRRNRYDLATAIAGPPNDIDHLRCYGIENYKNYEENGPWLRTLRRSGKNTARK